MMETYKYEKIRNVVLLGHGGCGKTTIAEAMALVTGVTNRQGKVSDGNTVSDYDKEEIKRKFSINTSIIPIIYEDTKINILDTPGYFDFVGEVEEALCVADSAVIVISAKAGIEVGTLKAWDYCEKYNLPRMFFVTDMDDDNASYREVVESLIARFGKKIAPFQSPIRENGKFVGFVNVVKRGGRRYTNSFQYDECEIPDYAEEYVSKYREALFEAVAETDELLMEKYFEGEEFTQQEISTALRSSVISRELVPVLMGSGLNAQGVAMLLQEIEKYFPSPNKGVVVGTNIQTGETFSANYDANLPMTAKVFKTIVDPFIGKYTLVKVCSGVLKADSTVYNTNKESEEKIGKLYVLRGKEQIEVKELYAGDIGAIGKLNITATGDTISTKAVPVIFDMPRISSPYTYVSFFAPVKADDDKVSQALAKIMEEDLTCKVVNDSANKQSLLYGIGDQHIEVLLSKLQTRYKVQIEKKKPKVPYQETIRKKVRVQGKHKKQSGGHGQYGDVHIEFEPSGDLQRSYVFEEKVFGGSVPKNYFPAVEKGIAEGVLKGPLAGYPVVGIKAILVDGSYHPVDSSEMAFKMATLAAFKKGILDASPTILEPIVNMKVIVPEPLVGDILADANKRRGRVLGMDPMPNGKQSVTIEMPLSETFGYSTNLRSITGGMGEYSYEFARYEEASHEEQEKIIAESQKE